MLWKRSSKTRKVAAIGEELPDGECLRIKGVPVTVMDWSYVLWLKYRDRGFPSPVEFYRFPGRFTPMRHQLETIEFFLRHNKCFCLDGLGTGKTLSSLWAADFLLEEGVIKRVLIIAPLSVLAHVWEREIFQSFPHRKYVFLRGSREAKQDLARKEDYDFYLVNPESLHLVVNDLMHIDLVIVDEFTKFKNARTRRYKALRKFSSKRMWLLSATPAPQAPTDAYAPIRLVQEKFMSFVAFRDLTMMKVSTFKWVAREEADRIIAKYMRPAIRHRRRDCYDLPSVQVVNYWVDLTKEQKKSLEILRKEAALLLENNKEITAANAAVLLSKSLQIMGGIAYYDKGVEYFNAIPLLEELKNIVEQADCPVIIFTIFKACAELIAKHFQDSDFSVALIDGDVKQKDRIKIFDSYQRGEYDVLVAVPGVMSHGLTLTRGNIIVWASPPFSYEIYEQANGRVVRKGQDKKVLIYHIIQSPLAEELFERLHTRAKLQDAVLKLLEIS